jgi:AraC-like DNA-binding protein
MLMYVGNQGRDYGRYPFRPVARTWWQFQAVLDGEIGVLFPDGPGLLHSSTLWVFPPMHEHGWTGDPAREAEVAVFQFHSVPPVVENACLGTEERFLRLSLTRRQCSRLRELAKEALRFLQSFNIGSLISSEHILLELSLMVYEGCVDHAHLSPPYHAQHCVEKALAWYGNHLAEDPDQEAVARAAGVSVSHLRRLFHEIMGAPPRRILDRARFARATELMSHPALKLSDVAEQCGFQSASAFTRAFKRFFGCSPAEWRGCGTARSSRRRFP